MKFSLKILLFIVLFIFPLNVCFASSLDLNCPATGVVGDVINCAVVGSSDIELSAVKANLKLSNNLEFVSFSTNYANWQGSGDNGLISLYAYPNQSGNLNLGSASIRIKNDSGKAGVITLSDIYFYKADFSKFAGDQVSKNIKILSNNNNLARLGLIGYNISPEFNKDTLEYSATVDGEYVVIDAALEDSSATLTGIGRQSLNYGVNTFIVSVVSETGVKKEYKLVITRPEPEPELPKEDNPPDEEVDDKKDEENKEEPPKEEPPKEEEKPKEEKPKEEQPKDEGKIEIIKDSNSSLKGMIIDGYEIEFNSNVYQYTIEIERGIKAIGINAVPASDKASVRVEGNSDFMVGINEIKVIVTAENGNVSIYSIFANIKGDVCPINSLKIVDYEFDFDCFKYNYELEIDLEDSLNIDIVPSSENARVNIYNNDNLKHNDVISIVVNLDGVDYKYDIKILKSSFELENIVNSKQLIFLVVVVIVTLLYFTGRGLVKRRLKNKNI